MMATWIVGNSAHNNIIMPHCCKLCADLDPDKVGEFRRVSLAVTYTSCTDLTTGANTVLSHGGITQCADGACAGQLSWIKVPSSKYGTFVHG
jgi:hypothetical protein